MSPRATLEVAYDILSNDQHPLPFYELWEKVCGSQDFSKDQCFNLLSRFYTNLTLDGRFVNLGDNIWELRVHLKSSELKLELNEVYSDVDEADEDIEEKTLLLQAGEVTVDETGLKLDEDNEEETEQE
ncbi:MAG TPA: DNA-directed RNA polymerase subunit delta [Bacilli bacterium]|nr:DNA-directed RNA polymerase subunit delta [Bacilli bacterium]